MASVLVIDGSNFDALRKVLGCYVNYRNMLDYVDEVFGDLLRGYYFTAVREHGPQDSDFYPLVRLLDSLEYNGFTIVKKEAFVMTSTEGKSIVKGNMDVELALTTYKIALNPNVTDVVLVTGDGDFTELVKCLQEIGKRVCIMFSREASKTLQGEGARPLLSDRLLRQADSFEEMRDLPFMEEHKHVQHPRDDFPPGGSVLDANVGSVRIIRSRTRVISS